MYNEEYFFPCSKSATKAIEQYNIYVVHMSFFVNLQQKVALELVKNEHFCQNDQNCMKIAKSTFFGQNN